MASSNLLDGLHDGEELRVPPASHRHAAPSGPWPWMDIGFDFTEITEQLYSPPTSPGVVQEQTRWNLYPSSLFPNWRRGQVERCRMLLDPPREGVSKVYQIDVLEDDGQTLPRSPTFEDKGAIAVHTNRIQDFWETLQEQRPENVSMRLLFVHNMTVPVLQMLGTQYVVEPFFFSSSINWIPSRYQESSEAYQGDHITITLPFVRALSNWKKKNHDEESTTTLMNNEEKPMRFSLEHGDEQIIDVQKPLSLRSSSGEPTKVENHDRRAIPLRHYVDKQKRLLAEDFREIERPDVRPPCDDVVSAVCVGPGYGEALRADFLESQVIKTNDMHLVRQLHIIQAHLLHYASLLSDFKKSVVFVRDTRHPALANEAIYTAAESKSSRELMQKESSNLLSEIDRLDRARDVQINRLKNVMGLAFATVNIEDSKDMRKLTEAAVRDSAAMRQVSYLTMFFLPGTFAAGIFGMNITEIVGDNATGSIPHYLAVTLTLTAFTVWLVVALQSESPFHEKGKVTPLGRRMLWPYTFLQRHWRTRRERHRRRGILDRSV